VRMLRPLRSRPSARRKSNGPTRCSRRSPCRQNRAPARDSIQRQIRNLRSSSARTSV
jgi:hypothetical protein